MPGSGDAWDACQIRRVPRRVADRRPDCPVGEQAVCSNAVTAASTGRGFLLSLRVCPRPWLALIPASLHQCAQTPSLSPAVCPSHSGVSPTELRYTNIIEHSCRPDPMWGCQGHMDERTSSVACKGGVPWVPDCWLSVHYNVLHVPALCCFLRL